MAGMNGVIVPFFSQRGKLLKTEDIEVVVKLDVLVRKCVVSSPHVCHGYRPETRVRFLMEWK